MTKEEKQLLLKDLCARLPYGVIVDYKENEFEFPHWKISTIYPETLDGWIGYYKRVGTGSQSGSRPFKIGEIKPYLRPMGSMTEEECKELGDLPATIENVGETLLNIPYYIEVARPEQLDWLNKNHFDYRGLIEKGLALEAPKNMYKTE